MKKSNYPVLTTDFSDEMDINMPWNEYPRPSMVRGSFLCLNGSWDFKICGPTEPESYEDKILVPFPPESTLSGINREIPKGSYMHYSRSFTLPEEFRGGRLLLHFGAVDTVCRVYLNGKELCEHEGGYLPFSFDITDLCLEGENTLYVRVKDDLDTKYPYGKQTRRRGGMWYTPVSGIWQTVWIERVPEQYITNIRVTPTVSNVTIEVFGGASKKTVTVGEEKYEFLGERITISPKEIHLWSPEDPYLYSFTLESGEDRVESYFALREIGVRKIDGIPRLTLNGEPYLFNGLLDQGYYPDGIFLPATSRGYEYDIRTAKECGFNMLRKHIKIEPEIFYNLCDRLGMVVFQDMVNNSDYSFITDTVLPTVGLKRLPDALRHNDKTSRDIFTRHSLATMEHLHFFPCILYYTIFNEGWGQFKADGMYDIIKSKDSTRIIDSTSGWFHRHKSDVDSRHVYFKPVKLGKRDGRPIVISEFGGYSHRVGGHLFGEDNYGYRIFKEREEFENSFARLYSDEILPLISQGICALVYTQVSDVEDETNGLLTYDRRVLKVDKFKTKALMQRLYNQIK